MVSEAVHHWFVPVSGLPAPFNQVNMDTLLMAWLAMGIVLVTAMVLRGRLQLYPSVFQTFGESMFDFCRSITMATAGKRGDQFLFYVGSLLLFILTANLLGQLPLHFLQMVFHYEQGELIAATGDINVPLSLALLTLVMYFLIGIRKKKAKYFLHYLQPHWAFLPINLMEDVTRPGSLMIRLYANILVGEILATVAMSITPFVLPVGVIFLELFVAVVQAYIFAMLSSVYITLLSAEDH